MNVNVILMAKMFIQPRSIWRYYNFLRSYVKFDWRLHIRLINHLISLSFSLSFFFSHFFSEHGYYKSDE